MAKKSGMSLNPGADATLVAAATRAAMANVPKDLSGTFESMARSYDAAMKSLGNSIKAVGEKVAPLVQDMIKDAIKSDSMITQGSTYEMVNTIIGPETEEESKETPIKGIDDQFIPDTHTATKTTTLGDELIKIREEQISLRGKMDRDSKVRRSELKSKKEKLYGEIEFLGQADNFNNKLLASGNFSPEATGQMNTLMAGALQAYKTKSGKIQEGEYKGYHVTAGRNTNEDITFTLRDPSGNIVTGENTDGSIQTGGKKPFTVKSGDINNLLVPKYSQDKLNGVTKIYNALLTSQASKTPYSSLIVGNKIAPFVDTENDLLGLMQKPLGANPTSFVEELNSASETSAAYFASLGSVTLKKLGVTDSDKSGTVGDAGDFANADNYAIVRSKLLDKSNPNYSFKDTQKAFLSYATEVGRKMHNFQPVTNNNNNNNNLGKSYIDAAKSYVSYEDQDKKVNQAKAGQTLYDWQGFKYTTTDGGKTYTDPSGLNEPTADVLSGTRFGLSNRLGGITFGGGGGGAGGGGENPFGETQANRAPADFVTAVGKDDIDVVAYLEGMGITVKNKLGDKVEVEINGKTKTFTVDPNIASDEARANEMWKWMFENWNKKKLK